MEGMKEYIERTAALNAARRAFADQECDCEVMPDVFAALQEVPAADVVEVVRCRECTKSTKGGASYVWCHGWGRNTEMPPDGYCSYGQRKEADHD